MWSLVLVIATMSGGAAMQVVPGFTAEQKCQREANKWLEKNDNHKIIATATCIRID